MRQLIVGIATFLTLMVVAGPALAGGWAVSTLDSVPTPVAGQTVKIGFTIRQHGATPVEPGGDVGIVLLSPTHGERFFPAEPAGQVGHFVAEVTFPDGGTWTWAIRQGWFGEQALGVIEPTPSPYRGSGWVRLGLPVLAVALAVGAIADTARHRRRRRSPQPGRHHHQPAVGA